MRNGGSRGSKSGIPNAQCPMPNAQCPMPNAPCPMPHAPFPMPNTLASCHHCRDQHRINNMDHAIVCQNVCFDDIGVIYLNFAVGRFNGYN